MSIPEGVYRGSALLDVSPGLGEIEVTVRAGALVEYRLATGSGIIRTQPPSTATLTTLTPEQIQRYFYPENDTRGYEGYRLESYGTALLLGPENPAAPTAPRVHAWHLRCAGTSVNALTMLFTPDQVAAGHFDYEVRKWEELQHYPPGTFPRL